jgi:predicted dehydrogenase
MGGEKEPRALRAALVGYGNIGPVHARAVVALRSARLAAVCDLDPARLELARADWAAEQDPPRLLTDYAELLSRGDIDVVHLCTPHFLHLPMAAQALRSGCHVLLEKPMALDFAGAVELEKVWRESGRQLGLCFQNRYRPSVIEAMRLLKKEEFGKLLGIRAILAWKRDAAYYAQAKLWKGHWATEGGGVLINQAIHTIDLIQWLGGGCSYATAIGGNLTLPGEIEVEDTAVVSMRLSGGARAMLFATNGHVEDSPVEIEILCARARLRIDETLRFEMPRGAEEPLAKDGMIDRPRGLSDATRAYWGSGHASLIADFYDCILDGRPFPLDPTEGKKTMAILDAAYAAIGRPQGVSYA